MRARPQPRSASTSTDGIFLSSGVSVSVTSPTGAAAEAMSETGLVTVFFSPFSSQAVRIERESLPTGTEMPSATQKSLAPLTASKSLASSPAAPQAAIQLRESFTSGSFTSAAAMLVSASPTAMRLAAAASITAIGVRSPIDMASPRFVSKPSVVTPQSATGTCQGPTI